MGKLNNHCHNVKAHVKTIFTSVRATCPAGSYLTGGSCEDKIGGEKAIPTWSHSTKKNAWECSFAKRGNAKGRSIHGTANAVCCT